jgi:hypothetical protein
MRAFFWVVVVIVLFVLALGGLEAIASRSLPMAEPLPNAAASRTWYWR